MKEFSSGQEIVDELAVECRLNDEQQAAYLETIYRKENRVKKANLWHRLLFRAADSLAKGNLVTRPTQTERLTGKKEWMLTEKGFEQALGLCHIPRERKDFLSTKYYEVQKVVKHLLQAVAPVDYDPFDRGKKRSITSRESVLRTRGFRQAVIEAYDYKCAVCGLKIKSPDSIIWEVQAAHIVPNSFFGRDDICNGVAFCHLHHWAFDVGWFTLSDDYRIQVSPKISSLPVGAAKVSDYEFLRSTPERRTKIFLPDQRGIYPHRNALEWHRHNIFYESTKETRR